MICLTVARSGKYVDGYQIISVKVYPGCANLHLQLIDLNRAQGLTHWAAERVTANWANGLQSKGIFMLRFGYIQGMLPTD